MSIFVGVETSSGLLGKGYQGRATWAESELAAAKVPFIPRWMVGRWGEAMKKSTSVKWELKLHAEHEIKYHCWNFILKTGSITMK